MNTFVDSLAATDTPTTLNGAKTLPTSGKAIVDFFFLAGASRGKDISKSFDLAMRENEELALRALLWTRDIRGGVGERQTFRDLLVHLETHYPNALDKILELIPEVGRWDDLLVLRGIGRLKAFTMIRNGLFIEATRGLVAKWMPRQGRDAVALREFLGMSPKQYRKFLVHNTKVVETQMCARQWPEIIYDHVPSVASARYRKAFYKHDNERYEAYVNALKQQQADPSLPQDRKINAGAIFPHDVIKNVMDGVTREMLDAATVQWNALPDFIGEGSFIPLIDTSGSMYQFEGKRRSGNLRPIHVAISLGLYTAERNKSAFKDVFVAFESNPRLGKLSGNLKERIKQIKTDHLGSTNVQGAFLCILEHAILHKVPQSDMPKCLLVISDMEFNRTVSGDTNFEAAKQAYRQGGYELPMLVFWNLNGREGNSPVEYTEKGTVLVSGFSPAVIKNVLSQERMTPYDAVIKTLLVERYNLV